MELVDQTAIEEIRRRLTREITRLATRRGGDAISHEPRFRRMAIRFDALDPLPWLRLQCAGVRTYWASRDRTFEVAGVGIAHELCGVPGDAWDVSLGSLEETLRQSDEGFRYYGGMRFYGAHPEDSSWGTAAGFRFLAPRFEVVRRGSVTHLVCNLRSPADEQEIHEIAAAAAALRFEGDLTDASFVLQGVRCDTPDRKTWHRTVSAAIDELSSGELEKVVLARRSCLEFEAPLDPVALLSRLRSVTPACFHFCFQPGDGGAFLGASPERLYRREGDRLETEAVAGTRPRGASPERDDRLGNELLGSDKDGREHDHVRRMLRASLEPICRRVDLDENVSLLKLARGQHLFTAVRATLAGHVCDAELLRRLHPTPAVGGCPTDLAVARILEWEGFDRGWYAAPIGWLGRNEAEFAVAIRSALVDDRRLSLFSGAGIVKGSTPESEWDEIEHKIQDFIEILTGESSP